MPEAAPAEDRRDGERTLRVDLPIVLPDVDHAGDACVDRIRERLAGQRGVLDAHVVGAEGQRDPAVPGGELAAELCLHYDPEQVDLDTVEHLVEDAGADVTERYGHERLVVEGMDCGDCSTSIEHVVARHEGVLDVSVNYAAERMYVEWDTERADLDAILDRVEAMGYEVHRGEEDRDHGSVGLTTTVAAAVLLAAGFVGEAALGLPGWAALVLYAGAYAGAGWEAGRHALGALRAGTVDVDVLMVAAALGAAALGLWAEGALLLVLFSLGHALEHRALDRARSAIGELGRLRPGVARRLEDGEVSEVAVEQVAIGDRVVVGPGERLPVDGEVDEGVSAVDEATLTGESEPVRKEPGDPVYAGTVNGEARLVVEATRAGRDTTLDHVAELVERAQTRKAGLQRASERVESWLTPAVFVLVGLVALVPALAGAVWSGAPGWLAWSWRTGAVRAIAVLVAAAPCALAISTPAAVLSALATSGRRGVLVKGGDHLERLGQLEAVAFDKTGTLTRGEFTVTAVEPRGIEPDELLRRAACLEHDVSHPIGAAIVAEASQRGLSVASPEAVETDPGRGVSGVVDGRRLAAGNRRHVGPPDEALRRAEELEAEGNTVVFVEDEEGYRGLIGLADAPRPEAAGVVEALRSGGVEHQIVLTGDNATAARAVADEVGLDAAEAELTPQDKAERVAELRERFEGVALVGDGVNDAPAMAAADLGVAMGAKGSDVALETADVALLRDTLEELPGALDLGRRTRRVVLQNLAISLAVIVALVPLAIVGLAGIGPAIVAHEGSTLLVVANGLRLLG